MNDIPAHELLRAMPVARREAAIRAALPAVILLLESAFNAVGFPKEDGRWSSALAHDLEAVRKLILDPPKVRPEI